MIEDFFTIKKGVSGNMDNYSNGDVPFISNTVLNNGVARLVTPMSDKEMLPAPSIAVNGFGYATVQLHPYIGAGNGGVYVSALVPKDPNMTIDELVYYAAQINIQSWRFSYGRRAIKPRLIEDIVLRPYALEGSELLTMKNALRQKVSQTLTALMG
ncbi:MAG TPA: hypothetical protein VFT53_04095 [Candidatus Saccharimonadales bacterium]|nr:hypothetical protein [Candidatus Saccharimonadales bacterium]